MTQVTALKCGIFLFVEMVKLEIEMIYQLSMNIDDMETQNSVIIFIETST